MSVLNEEVQNLVKNKYLLRGLDQDINNWSEDELMKVYHRLLGVFDPAYDGNILDPKRSKFRICSYMRGMGIGYLVVKKDDLNNRGKALKIITTLDNAIDGRYGREAASQRVRAVAKQEQLKYSKLKRQKQNASESNEQENVAPNFQKAISTQKIMLQDTAQGSVDQNPEKTPPVSQGFQLPRTPFVTDKLKKSKGNQIDDSSSSRGNVIHAGSSIPIGVKDNFQVLSDHNIIPSGHQIPRTPKSVHVLTGRVGKSTLEIVSEVVSSTQECYESEDHPGSQDLKVVNQKCAVEKFSASSVMSPCQTSIQSNVLEIPSVEMSAKSCLNIESAANLNSYSEQVESKEEKYGTKNSVGSRTSVVSTCEDNTSYNIPVQALDSEINPISPASLPSKGMCDRRKTFVVCQGHSASDKPNETMEIQSSENESCTELPVLSKEVSVMSCQKELILDKDNDLAFTHKSSSIGEAAYKKNLIIKNDLTSSEYCVQKLTDTYSLSPHRQILPNTSPISTDNLVSPPKDENDITVPAISRKFCQLEDYPLSITGTPEVVSDTSFLRESRKNVIPQGKQLKRTPTGPSPIDEKETGCIVVNSILEGNNRTFDVTVIEPDLDYSLQIFVKGEAPKSLKQDEEKYSGNSTDTLVEPGSKILSTEERTQEIGSRIEKRIMPKQIFKEEQITLLDNSIKKYDCGIVNRDMDVVQKCRTDEIKSTKIENSGSKNENIRDSEDLPKCENATYSAQNEEEKCRKSLDLDIFDESLEIFLPRKGKKCQTSANKSCSINSKMDHVTQEDARGTSKTKKSRGKKSVKAKKTEKDCVVDEFSVNPEIKNEECQIKDEKSNQTNEKQESSAVKPRKRQGRANIIKNLSKKSADTNLMLVTDDGFEVGFNKTSADSAKRGTLVLGKSPNHDAAYIENDMTNVKNEKPDFTLPSQQDEKSEPVGNSLPARKNGNGVLTSTTPKCSSGANAKESVSSRKTTKKQNNSTKQKRVSGVIRVSNPYENADRKSDLDRGEKCVDETQKQSSVAKPRKSNRKISTYASDKLEVDSSKTTEINSSDESDVTCHSLRIQKDSSQFDISKRKESTLARGVSNIKLNKSAVVCPPNNMQDGTNHTKLTGKSSIKTQYRAPRSKKGAVPAISKNLKQNLVPTKSLSRNDERTDQSDIASFISEMDENYVPPKSDKGQRRKGNASQETVSSNKTTKGKILANKRESSNKRAKITSVPGEGPSDVKRVRTSVDLSDTCFVHSLSKEVSDSIADCSEIIDYKGKSGISNKKPPRRTGRLTKASCQVSRVGVDCNEEGSNVSKRVSVSSKSNNLRSRTSRTTGKKEAEKKCESVINASRKRSCNQNKIEEPLQVKEKHISADLSNGDPSNSANKSNISVSLEESLVLQNGSGILATKIQVNITNRKKEKNLTSKMNKPSSSVIKQNFLDGSISVSGFNISLEEVQKDTSVHKQSMVSSVATNLKSKSTRGRCKRGTDIKLEVIEEINELKKNLGKGNDIPITKNNKKKNTNEDDRATSTDILVSARPIRKCKTNARTAIADMLEDEETGAYANYPNRKKVQKAKLLLKT